MMARESHLARHSNQAPARQCGYALLLGLLGVMAVVGVGAVEVSRRWLDEAALQAPRPGARLASAREALAAYNVDDDTLPGSLPCPDFTGDGVADIHCQSGGEAAYTQRLPWRTLDTPDTRLELWYALDRRFRDNPDPSVAHPVVPLNSRATGALRIDGERGFAAVIIAAGGALGHQDRVRDAIGAYLEGDNADGDRAFERCHREPDCNDRVVGLRPAELLARVRQRLVRAVGASLADFVDARGRYPWAAPLGRGDGACRQGNARGALPVASGDCGRSYLRRLPAWIRVNRWYRSIYYAVAPACARPRGACDAAAGGLLELAPQSRRAALWAATGRPIVSPALGRRQRRRGPIPHDVREYLERAENVDGDAVFVRVPAQGRSNDRLRAHPIP